MNNRIVIYFLIALFVLAPVSTYADVIHLDNGDKITGTINQFTQETVQIKTAYDGTLEIPVNRLATLETDRPMTVKFGDGQYHTGRIVRTGPDSMSLETGDDGIESFSLGEVDRVFVRDPREVLRDQMEVKLSGALNVGFDKQSGNTNQESYHVDGNMRARTPENRYTLGFEYNQEQTDDTLTEENALAFGKYDHFLSEKWYLFSSTTLSHDAQDNLDLRSNLSTGIGYQFYETEKRFLLLEVGGSYTNESYESSTPSIDYFGSRYSLDYSRRLYDGLRFFHFEEGLIGTGDEGDFSFRSQTGFKFPLAKGLQSTLQFNLDWDQEPPANSVRTDRQYLFTLGYTF